jgi:hypothetical protein
MRSPEVAAFLGGKLLGEVWRRSDRLLHRRGAR